MGVGLCVTELEAGSDGEADGTRMSVTEFVASQNRLCIG